MTFDEIKKQVGKNLKLYDDTEGWLSGRDVTEGDIGDDVNFIYREKMFPLFASRWPHLFRKTATFANYLLDATVNSSSTGSTLVIDTDDDTEFANTMIGLTVYNEDLEETRVIEGFTSTTTVTVDEDIDDDWDGDTVYVLGSEFAFGGDAANVFSVERVSIKYESEWDYLRIVEFVEKQDLFPDGYDVNIDRSELGSKAAPSVYLTSVLDSGDLYLAVGILPAFSDEPLTKEEEPIVIDYIGKPAEITGSDTIPAIPIQASLVSGATWLGYEKSGDPEMSERWKAQFLIDQKQDISRYRPKTTNVPTKIKVPRRYASMHRRDI